MKRNPELVRLVKEADEKGESRVDIARWLEIHPATVTRILGAKQKYRVDREAIKAAESSGKSRSDIARDFGISPGTVTKVLGAKRVYRKAYDVSWYRDAIESQRSSDELPAAG